MGLLGTLIGGGLGFMLGGPLGAIIGGALGSNVGDTNGGRRVHPGARVNGQRRGYSPLQAQQTFMIAMISLAAKVAKADGKVTKDEVRSFDHFLRNNLGMPADERRIAARIFNEARDSSVPASEFTRQIRDTLGRHPQRMRDLVSLLFGIAIAFDLYAVTNWSNITVAFVEPFVTAVRMALGGAVIGWSLGLVKAG